MIDLMIDDSDETPNAVRTSQRSTDRARTALLFRARDRAANHLVHAAPSVGGTPSFQRRPTLLQAKRATCGWMDVGGRRGYLCDSMCAVTDCRQQGSSAVQGQ